MLIYGAIASFGFLFLLVMLFVGELFGGDHDLGGHDVAGDHGDLSGPSILSARVMASFVTAFGVGGVVARYYSLGHPAASGVGAASGLVLAAVVYQFARLLYSQQATTGVPMADLVGQTGEVAVAIPDGGVGQVALTVGGERSEHIARSADGRSLSRGSEVVVTGLRGGAVVVKPASTPSNGGSR